MRSKHLLGGRGRTAAQLGVAFATVAALVGHPSGVAAEAPLFVTISDNEFVNGSGQVIRMLGVNHPSFEYACEQGYGYDDGHMDDADAGAIASWNANAVRIPLNEDCWLGINSRPNTAEGEALTQAGYQQAVEQYVAALHAHGLYAILDLHWSAPGTLTASSQQPMPDAHSPAFWTSVASTFKDDPAVVFDVFNEPYSPADPRSGEDPAHPVSWGCWDQGGCTVPSFANQGQATGKTYTATGMQELVSAIRDAGARQPILIGGLDFANDLTGWLENAPADPLGQEAASFHNYMGKTCDNVGCWNTQIAPVAAAVPVVTGEFDEDNYEEPKCANKTPSNFDQEYMSWADTHGVGYLAWGWWVLTQKEKDENGCSAFYLLEDHGGTPAAPNGTALHDHLLSLPPGGVSPTTPTGASGPTGPTGGTTGPGAGAGPPVTLTAFKGAVVSGGSRIAFTLRAGEACAGTLTGETVNTYAVPSAAHKRHHVALGRIHFALQAGRAKTVVLTLSKVSRKLLRAKGTLKVRILITLTATGHSPTAVHHTMTLRLPSKHK